MWKEAVVGKFEILAHHLLIESEAKPILNQDNRCPIQDLNQTPPKNKSDTLLIKPAFIFNGL